MTHHESRVHFSIDVVGATGELLNSLIQLSLIYSQMFVQLIYPSLDSWCVPIWIVVAARRNLFAVTKLEIEQSRAINIIHQKIIFGIHDGEESTRSPTTTTTILSLSTFCCFSNILPTRLSVALFLSFAFVVASCFLSDFKVENNFARVTHSVETILFVVFFFCFLGSGPMFQLRLWL